MNITRFLQLVEAANAVIDSDAADEIKWELILGRDALCTEIDKTGVDYDYSNMDDGYGFEARHYVDCVNSKAEELRKLGAGTIQKYDGIWA